MEAFKSSSIYKGPDAGTHEAIVEAALDLAELKPGETFVDLGFGDGRMLFAAAKRGAVAMGVEDSTRPL
jgi:cyclopropane fatty-acyl-phospholipid synthase-like methyltransferase